MGSFFSKNRLQKDPHAYASLASESKYKSYDYIIVGAGATGCVLASRLSEDPSQTVLLVEAGPSNVGLLEARVPMLFSKLFHSKHDWDYITEPQPHVNSRQLYWPRGKLLGGSTSMNAMIYHHCAPSDFDEWAEKYGAEGWDYNSLSPYIRKAEKFTPNADAPVDMTHRGTDGLYQTGYAHHTDIARKGFIRALDAVGLPFIPDVNTPNGTLGCTYSITSIDSKGQRCSSATAYLTSEVQARPNLTIAVDTRVTRIVFEHMDPSSNPRAVGVEIATGPDAPVYRVNARREVICSGGSINTPQLLKLSGIGPKAELDAFNIPLVKDLPAVGRNLKDHLCPTAVICRAKKGTTLDYLGWSQLSALAALAQWLITGSGPLSNNVAEAISFFRSTDPSLKLWPAGANGSPPEDNSSGPNAPDVELLCGCMAYIDHGADPGPFGEHQFSLVVTGLRPRSSGTVTLKSSWTWDKPAIDPNYWSDENDVKVMLAALRLCLRISRTAPFTEYLEVRPFNNDKNNHYWPAEADPETVSDEDLLTWAKAKAFTLYHPVGTARIGRDDRDSVVDIECRVHGVDGLRVIDASIFPEQISGHPSAVLIGISEKMSESIIRGRA